MVSLVTLDWFEFESLVLERTWETTEELPKPPLGPPAVPFYPFLGDNSPTKIDKTEKRWYPYSNLSTGGPRNTYCGGTKSIAPPKTPWLKP